MWWSLTALNLQLTGTNMTCNHDDDGDNNDEINLIRLFRILNENHEHDMSERKRALPALRGPLLVTACWHYSSSSAALSDCCSLVAHWPQF